MLYPLDPNDRERGYACCACGSSHTGGTKEWDCEKFLAMRCGRCGKELFLTLCTYDRERTYYCEEHCPDPPRWQENEMTPTECERCGVQRGDYWERKYRALQESTYNAAKEG